MQQRVKKHLCDKVDLHYRNFKQYRNLHQFINHL